MISTQTIADLMQGSPSVLNWVLFGAWASRVHGETNDAGYGINDYVGVLNNALREIQDRYGSHVHLVNAKLEPRAGNAHESYARYSLFITGDLYYDSEFRGKPGDREEAQDAIEQREAETASETGLTSVTSEGKQLRSSRAKSRFGEREP